MRSTSVYRSRMGYTEVKRWGTKMSWTVSLTALSAMLMLWGCTSAETGASNRAGEPQQEMVQPTFEPAAPPVLDTLQKKPATTTIRRSKTTPRVRSSQDTVRAATARRSRPAPNVAPIVKPPNAMYTVQVGAFRLASNALRLQRVVKRQWPAFGVYNDFHSNDKLYRVTVGKFVKRAEASALRRRLIAFDSTAYGLCWVTYTQR